MAKRNKRIDDPGYSLIEILVAMAITVTALGLVTSAMIGTLQTGVQASTRLGDLDQVRAGVDALSRSLRTAIDPGQLNPNCTSVVPMDCASEFEQIANN